MLFFDSCHKRSLASWQICFTILILFSSSSYGRTLADSFGSDPFKSSSSSSPRKTLDQEIGSPSELAWQAWLLVENKNGAQSGLDSSNILRRITPKSIFIAPELISCPSGYSSDGKGVCKPDPIKIDEDAQRQFFLKRLNALYGKLGNNRKKPTEAAGPLQINIPISLPAKANPPEPQPIPPQQQQPEQPTRKIEQKIVVEDRLTIPIVISEHPPVQTTSNKSQEPSTVVVYKVSNDSRKEQKTTPDEEKTTFIPGVTSTATPKKDVIPTSQVVPVAEIVDEVNETFSGVVDYKIPVNVKPIYNRSNIFDQKKFINDRHHAEKKVDIEDSSDETSPTVVLLLSSTKIPSVTSTPKQFELSQTDVQKESSLEQESEENESTTVQTTQDDIKSESDVTVQTVVPLDTQTTVDVADNTIKSTERAYTEDRLEEETVYTDVDTQTEQESQDQEDYEDTTDSSDQDDFGESEDEILKPGEAGMMISATKQDLIQSKKHKQRTSTLPDTEERTSTTMIDTTTMPTYPTFNTQSSFGDTESTYKTDPTDYTKEDLMTTQTTEIPSTIATTTEPIEETTIYIPRPLRAKNLVKSTFRTTPTQTPVTTTTEIKYNTDSKDLFETERDLVTEPEVIFSTQGSHSMTTTYGRKKITHQGKITNAPYTFDDVDIATTRTELPRPIDLLHRNPSNYRRQKPSITINPEPVIFNNDDIPPEFKDQLADSSRTPSGDFRRIPSHINDEPSTYVRFPEEIPESRSGFVRFPSDEVNSIHNQENYKDLLSPYRSRDEYNASLTSTKSSVPARQKAPSAHWRILPSSVRTDRQHQQTGSSNSRQKQQKPMQLRFWARMPLVRDLSFYPTTSHGSHNEPIGGQDETHRRNSRFSSMLPPSPSQRVNFYKEMSSHDVHRLLVQQLGQPAIGD